MKLEAGERWGDTGDSIEAVDGLVFEKEQSA